MIQIGVIIVLTVFVLKGLFSFRLEKDNYSKSTEELRTEFHKNDLLLLFLFLLLLPSFTIGLTVLYNWLSDWSISTDKSIVHIIKPNIGSWIFMAMMSSLGYAVFAEFYLKNNRRGFYYGPSIFLYNKSVELSSTNEIAKFRTLYPNLRAGYVWYPFKNINLYLNPWFNIGSEINIDNNNSLNGIDYEPSKFYYIVALHIGYSFNW